MKKNFKNDCVATFYELSSIHSEDPHNTPNNVAFQSYTKFNT